MDTTEQVQTSEEHEEQSKVDDVLFNIKFIPRLYIPKGKLTIEHAKQCMFPGENATVEQKLSDLESLKNDAKEWFRNELSKLMVAEIQDQNLTLKIIKNDTTMTVPVRNFEDFLEKVEQDSSDEMMKIIFEVSHGFFDRKSDWQTVLEDIYMKEFNFQYADISTHTHKSKGKGCFEILCCGEKTELVKRIQRAGKRSHGKYITLELPRRSNGGYKKRKLGMFYPEFVKTIDVDETKISKKTKRYREVIITSQFFNDIYITLTQLYFLIYIISSFY